MAITHLAAPNQTVVINPGDTRGPWTVQLPDTAPGGAYVTVRSDAFDDTPITIEAVGNTKLEDPRLEEIVDPQVRNLADTVDIVLLGTGLTWRYNNAPDPNNGDQPRNAWMLVSSFVDLPGRGVVFAS